MICLIAIYADYLKTLLSLYLSDKYPRKIILIEFQNDPRSKKIVTQKFLNTQ